MKIPFPFLLTAFALLLACAGCGSSSLDLARSSDPARVVHGTINMHDLDLLPPDAVLVIRVVDYSAVELQRTQARKDIPVVLDNNQPKVDLPPQILAEQVIKAPSGSAIPFQIEFQADDDLLRHGLNIEARLSFGGQVRLRTVNAHAITLGNVNYNHEVWIDSR